jgi:hypothetical protein
MRMSGLLRFTAFALTLAVTPIVTGCGGNPFKPPVDNSGSGKLPDNTPPNDSPQNLMVRFETTYEYQVLAEYKLLLTQDFRFTFSNQTDPLLVTKYGNNWGKVDEGTSAGNMFDGFKDDQAIHHNGASSIDMQLTALNYGEDPMHLGDTDHYQKVIVTRLTGTIEIPSDAGGETSKFLIDARQEFYIVRGDVAALDTDQSADAAHWYIYRWDDLSEPLAGPAVGLTRMGSRLGTNDGTVPTRPFTFGSIKAAYR